MRRVTPSCFLCVVIGCCGLMDDGSVQQQRGVIGRNVYLHLADEMGNVSVDYLKRCRFVYRQKRPMSRRPGYFKTFSYSYASVKGNI